MIEENPCGEIKLGKASYTSGYGYRFVLINSNNLILAFSEINKEYYFTGLLSNEDCIVIKKPEIETIILYQNIMKVPLYKTDFTKFNHQLQ